MIVKLAWRNIWRNKRRSLITILSIFVAVFLAIFMRAMQLGMYDIMIDNVVGSYSGYVQIHKKGYWDEKTIDNSMSIDESLETKIKSIKGVKSVVPRLQTFSLATTGTVSKGLNITGIIPEREKEIKGLDERIIEGKSFSHDNEIIVAKDVAKFFKIGIGDTLILIGQGYHGASAAGKFVLCGIVNMKNPMLNKTTAFLRLTTFQEYLSVEDMVSMLVIAKTEKANEKKLVAAIGKSIDLDEYEVMDWHEMLPELDQTIIADSVGGLIMIFILYMIITFGIFGTVLMMVQERLYEMGVLIAVGMKKWKLSIVLLLETLFLTILGIILGIVGVMPLVYYFHSNPIQMGADQVEVMEQYGFEAVVAFLTDWSIPLTHGMIILIISLIISIYPIVVIGKLEPVKAMRK